MKQNKSNIVENNPKTTLMLSEQKFIEIKAIVAKSAYCLGMCYEGGLGTDKNETEAAKFYHIAAEQGDADALMALVRFYQFGIGVKKDLTEAVKWLRMAVEHDIPRAMFQLGNFYARGIGIERNDTEAFKWYCMAAERGVVDAVLELSDCYSKGIGVEVDKGKARSLFRMWVELMNDELQHLPVIDANDIIRISRIHDVSDPKQP